jgi:hypothetical protein
MSLFLKAKISSLKYIYVILVTYLQDEFFPDTTSPYAVIVPGGMIDRTKMEMFIEDYLSNDTAKPEHREKWA